MAMPSNADERLRQLHDRAVRELVDAHRLRKEEPLLLAVRYDLDHPTDIHLLEVLDGFPGGESDELMVTEFERSAQLMILGKLRLVLGSPAQLRAAIRRNDPEISKVKKGKVVFAGRTALAKKLRQDLKL